jgi:hypothetical protein
VSKPYEFEDPLTLVKGFVPPLQRGTDAAEAHLLIDDELFVGL